MSSIPDYMKILKSSPEKIEEFVNIQERYNDNDNYKKDDKDDDNDENPCLSGTYSRRNVLFIFVSIAILICIVYILLNKDIA
jgi:hypothetical protein